jgi:hypothetical protein
MIKSICRIGAVTLLAAAIAALPAQLLAQTTTNAAPAKKSAATKKKAGHPFHGKLAAIDKVAKTLKVGESVYQITSETKITKAGKPATLEDGVVGENVSGYAKPAADGKMVATSVHFSAKAEHKHSDKDNTQ